MGVSSQRLSPRSSPSGRDRPNSRGDATRLLILLKAEELFAERGIDAVPLRDIGAAAGQKNNVAVQYHFADRDNLVREIAVFRATESEAARAELLAELFAADRSPGPREMVRAFVLSLACHLEPDNHYLAFLSRYVTERGSYNGLEHLGVGNTYHTFTAMLRRLCPDVPEKTIVERWTVMNTSAVHTLARYQTANRSGTLPAPLDRLIEDLVTFFAGAVTAPLAPAGSPVADT